MNATHKLLTEPGGPLGRVGGAQVGGWAAANVTSLAHKFQGQRKRTSGLQVQRLIAYIRHGHAFH